MIIEFALIRNMNSKGENFIIYGMGKSGQAAFDLLANKNVSPEQIFLFDEKLNLNSFESLLEVPSGTVILSPGVPIKSDPIQNLIAKGWVLSSEINLACEFLTTEKIIGITGSVGKSTVTSMLGAAAKIIDPNVFVGGNLGMPFAQYAVDLQSGRPKSKWIILELSSYQLENCQNLPLDFSAITYLSANHMERYDSLDHYYQTKLQISKQTKDTTFVNSDSKDILKYVSQIRGRVEKSSRIGSRFEKFFSSARLAGAHNQENLALVLTIVERLNWGFDCQQEVLKFNGLPHRLEHVGTYNKKTFINDSKATSIDSVIVAAEAALEKLVIGGQLYILVGGKDKNLPWESLETIKKNSSNNARIKFIYFGQCGLLAKTKSTLNGPVFNNLAEALEKTFPTLKENDILLLSPGGTSLDEFKNFEERGSFFKGQVEKYFKR
jgi:UDP-N-acetylmuramoylalanine--D-glutamate ligase